MLRSIKALFLLGILYITCNGCIEPFDIATEDFENLLVIDASITDEIKKQEIFVSRTFSSEQETVKENGASIYIVDDTNTEYRFDQNGPGHYLSEVEFGAINGRSYQLLVETSDGKSYSSKPQQLSGSSEIQELKAIRTTNDEGIDGVSIFLTGTGDGDEESHFRYEYEETYRIESFFNPSKDLVIVSQDPPLLEIQDKTREEHTCYTTGYSNNIAIASTESLSESKVTDFPIRFISRTNRRVAHRYSILVKQLRQSREAYSYYETLKELSSNESVFSQTQPGFIFGNIVSVANPDEKVLGLFEITSVTSKRIFFNFDDIFDSTDIRYQGYCDREGFSLSSPDLFEKIKSGAWKFVGEDPVDIYNVAPIRCVDCNLSGSNEVPLFWQE